MKNIKKKTKKLSGCILKTSMKKASGCILKTQLGTWILCLAKGVKVAYYEIRKHRLEYDDFRVVKAISDQFEIRFEEKIENK